MVRSTTVTVTEPVAAPTHPAEEPRQLGRYALKHCVGRGGMASVYLAQLVSAEGFRKWVAVKVIEPAFAGDRKFVRMFLDEARLAARIAHPNVCTVFDFGESDGTYYLAMEYLHGEPLHAVAKRAAEGAGVPVELAARIVADAARGLHAAHELRADDGAPAGVVHCDVSPQNVFVLYDGVAKVVDFGIARSRGARSDDGTLQGKLAYMAPEQLEGAAVDRRADLWALGVVLWEISLGRRLFRRDTDEAVMSAVLEDAVPAPRLVRPEYPRELEAIVQRALARDPARRYATAAEMAGDLERFIASRGVPAGAGEVGEFMRATFADRIAAREELLRVGLADPFGAPPPDETTASRAGDVFAPPPARLGTLAPPRRAPPSRARNALAWLGVLVALAGIAGAAWFAWRALPPARPRPPRPSPIVPLAGAAHDAAAPARAVDAAAAVRPSAPVAGVARRVIPNAGYLVLDAAPGTQVFEGATLLGVAPLGRFPMAPGRHVIRAALPSGGAVRSRVVFITAGRVATASVR